MDWRSYIAWTFALVVAGSIAAPGCGSKAPPPPKAGSGGSSTAGAGSSTGDGQVAETHRPIIVTTDPFDPQSLQPLEGQRPFAGSPLESLSGLPADPWPAAAKPPPVPSPTDRALNPLRIGGEVPEPAAPSSGPNPLRSFSAEPRMARAPRPAPSGDAPPPPPETGTSEIRPPPTQPLEVAPPADPPSLPQASDPPNPTTAPSAAVSPAAALPAAEPGPFDVVQVFYGTDRRAAEPLANDWAARAVRFLPTVASGLLTLCMTLVAINRRRLGSWMLVFAGAGVSLGLGVQATSRTIAAIRQAGKPGVWYTTERSAGNQIELGMCQVTIPKTHISGELEAPSVLRLEVREDAAQHVVLRQTERLADAKFYELLKERVEQSPRKELFVFVHGFNVSFEDAARRTAQIHHDLHFDGAAVFFSWPARDKFVLTYPADEASVSTSAPHLKQFLLEIVRRTPARSINLIAHSMGNRALGIALREIDLELRGESKLFNQVILAAPDIDAEDFRTNIAPAMQRTAQRLTLYASSRDDALLASQLLHRGPRAGDAGAGLVVLPGIDTIDVTAIDSSPWGHSYYGSSDPVLTDLKALLLLATPAADRTWLSPAERDGLTYWIFQPARTAGAGAATPR